MIGNKIFLIIPFILFSSSVFFLQLYIINFQNLSILTCLNESHSLNLKVVIFSSTTQSLITLLPLTFLNNFFKIYLLIYCFCSLSYFLSYQLKLLIIVINDRFCFFYPDGQLYFDDGLAELIGKQIPFLKCKS